MSIKNLYEETFGAPLPATEPLPKAGSNRKYERIALPDGRSAIAVTGTDEAENRAFIALSRHFRKRGLPVPEVMAVSADAACYIQQDLGRRSLYDALRQGREAGGAYSPEEQRLIERTIRLLAHVQVEGAEGLTEDMLLQPKRFDAQAARFDLQYFKFCFLRTTDLPFDELALEADFERFAADLVSEADAPRRADGTPLQTFLYRDFQARNVMLAAGDDGDEQPWLIDFQGGRFGPIFYDVASFLYQASARYPEVLREQMVAAYLDELSRLCEVSAERFRERLQLFVLFRVLQVLGAYGLRGYFERKPYFLNSIPAAIANLRQLLDAGVCAPYAVLEEVLWRMVRLPQMASVPSEGPKAPLEPSPLVVRVVSFSYKKGIPEDESGNGGGYVFDCRAPHNPGRYEPYRTLTGLDAPVIDFLETDGEILPFLANVYSLADAHVARYIERGFTSLMFCFGCTGGQHRSVYAAQHLAEHVAKKFGVAVRLTHREQGIEEFFPAKA